MTRLEVTYASKYVFVFSSAFTCHTASALHSLFTPSYTERTSSFLFTHPSSNAGSSTLFNSVIALNAPSASSNSANPNPCGLFAGVINLLNPMIGPHAYKGCVSTIILSWMMRGGGGYREELGEKVVGDAAGDGADEERYGSFGRR